MLFTLTSVESKEWSVPIMNNLVRFCLSTRRKYSAIYSDLGENWFIVGNDGKRNRFSVVSSFQGRYATIFSTRTRVYIFRSYCLEFCERFSTIWLKSENATSQPIQPTLSTWKSIRRCPTHPYVTASSIIDKPFTILVQVVQDHQVPIPTRDLTTLLRNHGTYVS